MKISIITVCYNSAATIEGTLKSVSNQTYDNIEYIIVDGASSDSTIDIIKNYKDIITTFVSEPDKGLYDAMNKGLKMVTGDIIGFLNSDDIFMNNTVIENVANFHNTYDVMASVGDMVQHNDKGVVVREYSAVKWTPEKLKIGFMPAHLAVFINKSIYEKYGDYRLDFKIASDYELLTRFFLKHNITWKYTGITTTSMLIGGLSSSGYGSYKLISKEIAKSLKLNNITFSYFKIRMRIIWKIKGLL